MNLALGTLLSYSIVFAAIIGLVRFKKISIAFLPFLLFVWLGLTNEVVSYFTGKYLRNNAVNNNIYVLLEACLILWQLKKWGLFQNAKKVFTGFLITFVLFWIIEFFFVYKITYVTSYFRIFYSFVIVLMSINMVNSLILSENKSLLKNPVFLICIGFIIFFTYKLLVEIFWVYGLNGSKTFRTNVYHILAFVNLFANLIYALAALWAPRKPTFIMLY
jgi:hypothetical protein